MLGSSYILIVPLLRGGGFLLRNDFVLHDLNDSLREEHLNKLLHLRDRGRPQHRIDVCSEQQHHRCPCGTICCRFYLCLLWGRGERLAASCLLAHAPDSTCGSLGSLHLMNIIRSILEHRPVLLISRCGFCSPKNLCSRCRARDISFPTHR